MLICNGCYKKLRHFYEFLEENEIIEDENLKNDMKIFSLKLISHIFKNKFRHLLF